jgi:hypothetical protein
MDLLKALDPKKAAENVRTDIRGDWYSDPWKWPEIEWLTDTSQGQSVLAKECQRGSVHQVALIDVRCIRWRSSTFPKKISALVPPWS